MFNDQQFGRKLLLSIDAKSYGQRDDQRQRSLQDGLLAALSDAGARASLTRSLWQVQQSGDGELSVLPDSEPEANVVDDFVRELNTALIRHNRDLLPEARIRLRMAIHHGVAMPSSNGFTGQGIVVVSRMVDSPVLRAALAATKDADLVVLLSQRVFADTVVQGHTSLLPAAFRRVKVSHKELVEDAWLYVPGGDVHALTLPDGPAPGASAVSDATEPNPATATEATMAQQPSPAAPASAPTNVASTTIHGTVSDVGVIGIGIVNN